MELHGISILNFSKYRERHFGMKFTPNINEQQQTLVPLYQISVNLENIRF